MESGLTFVDIKDSCFKSMKLRKKYRMLQSTEMRDYTKLLEANNKLYGESFLRYDYYRELNDKPNTNLELNVMAELERESHLFNLILDRMEEQK